MSRIPGTTFGAELNDINEIGVNNLNSGTLSIVSTVPTPASGGYCLKAAVTGVGSATCFKRITLGATKLETWKRFKMYIHGATAASSLTFLRLLDSTNTMLATFTYNIQDGLVRAKDASNVQLGVTSSAIAQDQWNLLDLRQKMHSSSGVIEVWFGGNQKLNLTGLNLGSTPMLNFDLGIVVGDSGGGTYYFAFDDLAVNDVSGSLNNGRIGDGRVLYLAGTGAGSNTNQSIGGSVPAATNWQSTNEVPPDSGTTFVYSSIAGTRDSYAMADLPAGATSVNCVELIAQAQNSDAGAGSLGLTVKSGATTNEATAQALNTNWAYYRALYETDPNTSAAWTVSAVNAAEVGTTTE